MEGRETDLEYNLLMGLTGASVSKHLLDEHFTLLWANDFYYDMIGYPKEEYEALFHNKPEFVILKVMMKLGIYYPRMFTRR